MPLGFPSTVRQQLINIASEKQAQRRHELDLARINNPIPPVNNRTPGAATVARVNSGRGGSSPSGQRSFGPIPGGTDRVNNPNPEFISSSPQIGGQSLNNNFSLATNVPPAASSAKRGGGGSALAQFLQANQSSGF